MTTYLAALAGGLLGSAHCVGMCGGFAALVGANRKFFGPNLSRQLLYGLGRVFTYAFLGACAGYAGDSIADSATPLIGAQRLLSVAAGVVMLFVGVSVFAPRIVRRLVPAQLGASIVPVFRHFLGGRGTWGVFLAGVGNGFLPCGLVYAFVAMSMSCGSSLRGLLLMICFGLGTIPAMTLVGCGTTFLSHRMRLHVQRIAACVVIVAGAITIERGWFARDRRCCDTVFVGAPSN